MTDWYAGNQCVNCMYSKKELPPFPNGSGTGAPEGRYCYRFPPNVYIYQTFMHPRVKDTDTCFEFVKTGSKPPDKPIPEPQN